MSNLPEDCRFSRLSVYHRVAAFLWQLRLCKSHYCNFVPANLRFRKGLSTELVCKKRANLDTQNFESDIGFRRGPEFNLLVDENRVRDELDIRVSTNQRKKSF